MKTTFDQLTLDRMSKNPKYWRGPFYFNPQDPRLFVPKIDSSIGWGLDTKLWKYIYLYHYFWYYFNWLCRKYFTLK